MTESLSCQKHTFKASETKPKLQTTAVVEKGQVIKEITAAAAPKQANTLPSSNLNKKLTKSDNKKSKVIVFKLILFLDLTKIKRI
jgi:hypothetical protein